MNLPGNQRMQNVMHANSLLRQNTQGRMNGGPGGGGGYAGGEFTALDYQNMTEEERKTIPPDKLKNILRKIIMIGRLADTVSYIGWQSKRVFDSSMTILFLRSYPIFFNIPVE